MSGGSAALGVTASAAAASSSRSVPARRCAIAAAELVGWGEVQRSRVRQILDGLAGGTRPRTLGQQARPLGDNRGAKRVRWEMACRALLRERSERAPRCPETYSVS